MVHNFADILMESLNKAAALPVVEANQLMGIRLATNCFRHSALKEWISSNRSEVCVPCLFRNCRIRQMGALLLHFHSYWIIGNVLLSLNV
jgi:hypothetical protein